MSSTTDQAVNAVSDAASKAQGYASDLVGKAQNAASDLAGRAQSAASTAKSKAQDVASNVAGKASDVAHSIGTHPFTDTTAKIPTEAFIVAAGASIAGSLVLKFLGRHKDAEFIGHWAPTLISLGLLSKLIEHNRSANGTTDRTPSGEN